MLLRYLKSGFINSAYFMVSILVVRALSFFFLPIILNTLSLADFGVWDLYQTSFLFISAFVCSGLANAMIRFSLQHKEEPEQQVHSISNIVLIGLISCLLCFFIGFLIYSTRIFSSHISIVFCNVGLSVLFAILLGYMRLRQYLWWYSLLYCGQYLIFIGSVFLGIYYFNNGINAFFYAQFFSYAFFAPFFLILFYFYRHFAFDLLFQQLLYIIPIIFFNVFHVGFIGIERLYISSFLGLETLGLFAIIARFGYVLQYMATAIYDAVPVVFFKAQQEDNAHFLMPRLFSYMTVVITSSTLMAVVGAQAVIALLLPQYYTKIVMLLPFFFMYILLMIMSRFFQIGFHLATNTFFKPILLCVTLLIQCGSLWVFKPGSFQSFLVCNIIVFFLYSIVSLLSSEHVYARDLFEHKRLIKLLVIFVSFTLGYHYLFMFDYTIYSSLVLLSLWPIMMWLGIADMNERRWVRDRLRFFSKQYLFFN